MLTEKRLRILPPPAPAGTPVSPTHCWLHPPRKSSNGLNKFAIPLKTTPRSLKLATPYRQRPARKQFAHPPGTPNAHTLHSTGMQLSLTKRTQSPAAQKSPLSNQATQIGFPETSTPPQPQMSKRHKFHLPCHRCHRIERGSQLYSPCYHQRQYLSTCFLLIPMIILKFWAHLCPPG